MKISEKLKILRNEKGYSQSQVAKELFVSFQAISNWETGKTYPDICNLIKLSDFYNISLDELIKEDEQLKRKLENNKHNNLKIIGYTLVVFLGVLLLCGSIYIYIMTSKILWFSIIASIFFIIDGVILLEKTVLYHF